MTLSTLVLRYAAFAMIATLINLGAQRGVLLVGQGPVGLICALAVGTLAGLVVKYLLDKHWIFDDRATSLREHGQKFSLYTMMGLVTTALFWGMEAGFWAIWRTEAMRETGAVIGLAIGYVVKYNLDRRFVFNRSSLRETA
ncbi:GtrA family protein [Rhodobacter lacus]|uniref:GtrA family protein n=1 Tax=Rhodobacter lacus TaxID=1641972 RepID=A0ABW5AAJ8_9RHOB